MVEGTREVLGGIQRQVLCKKDKVLEVIFQKGRFIQLEKLPGVPQLVQIKGPLIEKSSFSIPMKSMLSKSYNEPAVQLLFLSTY